MTEVQEEENRKTNFFFIDDHGSLQNNQEWILRGGVLISIADYHLFSRRLNRLNQDSFGRSEIKWSDIQAVIYCKENGIKIKEHKQHYYLEKYEISFLKNYIIEFYGILSDFDFKVIVSVGKKEFLNTGHRHYLEFQIEDLMQRVQYENQEHNSLAIFVHDSGSNKKEDDTVKHYYKKLVRESRMVNDFDRIIDNLFIEYSHLNPGVQASDFVLGTISGVFRGYGFSKKLYKNFLQDNIRKSGDGEVFGFGIILTTQNRNSALKEIISNCLVPETLPNQNLKSTNLYSI